jgi:hypothetical protein
MNVVNIPQTACRNIAALFFCVLLAACGGGGGTTAAPTLSADQSIYESFALSPNSVYQFWWSLPVSGVPVASTDYLAEATHTMAASPLSNGPQSSNNTALTALSSSLPTPANTPVPSRYLVKNAVVVGSGPTWIRKVSYSGAGIQAVLYAVDGTTPVESFSLSNYSSTSLSGSIVTVNSSTAASAYPDLTNYYDEIFFNPKILKGTTSWAAGSTYHKYTQTLSGDLYYVFDYLTTQSNSGTTPTPVATGTTLTTYMASHSVHSSTDNTDYTKSNMTSTTVGTVPTYVANAPRPNRTTTSYYTLYELNGKIYCGEVIKDQTVIGGNSYHVGTPSSNTVNYSLFYQISLNQKAADSIKAALNF